VGSTGSGKSEGELVDLVRIAKRGDYAVVLLDGHGPLAFRTVGHWAARGHEARIVFEPLRATERVLCWSMLPKSISPSLSQRRIEDAETRDEVAQCFLAQRNLATLNDRPWTKDWLEAVIALCLSQPQPEPLESLVYAFRIGSPEYERLLRHCEHPALVGKFRDMERLRRRSEVQYEIQIGPSRRLVEPVCTSEVVRLRCRDGLFDWLQALQDRKLIAFDGGGIRSREIKRTIFSLASLQVIQAVRRHFALTQAPLPVVLVLEEAGAHDLVTPFVLDALQELRKAGLAVHVITQSSLDFEDSKQFEALLSHAPWQAWYQVLSPVDQELGARALSNATFDPLTVHFTRTRQIHAGTEIVSNESRAEIVELHTKTRRTERRSGTAHVPSYRSVSEPHYKTPGLHEQEFRTRLATFRVGERIVRHRTGVWRERVRRLRSHFLWTDFTAYTRAVIERIRRQPIYLPGRADEPPRVAEPFPDAAKRLRQRSDTSRGKQPADEPADAPAQSNDQTTG
jgi:hypothetical protein